MIDVTAARPIAACDSPIGILYNARAAIGHHYKDAAAVIPAAHAHQTLVCSGVPQPPVKSIGH